MTEPSKDAPEKHLFYWLNHIRNRAIVHGASWVNPKVWTVKNFTRHDFDSDNWMKLQMAVAYIVLHHRIWNAGQGSVAIPGGPRNPNLGQLKRAVRGRLLELLDRNPYLLPTDQADPRYSVTGRQVELRVPSRANVVWSVSLLPGLGATFYGPSGEEEIGAPPEEPPAPTGSLSEAFDWIPVVSEVWQAIQGLEDGSEQRELLELIGQVIKWAGTDFDAHRDDIAQALQSALRRFLS